MNRFALVSLSAKYIPRRFRGAGARELFLFGLVGGGGAVVYTGLNILFTALGIHPSLSIALTLVVLIPPVYYLQHRLTFRSGRNHTVAFPRYVGAQLFGNVLAMAAAAAAPGPIEAHPLPAWIAIAALVAALNYGILKFWVFRHPPAREMPGSIAPEVRCPTST